MTTISNNKLPEWRKALNSAVENYQSTQAWYEENQDSPSAGQDMDAAEGEIEKLIKQYGVLIVLNLLDEIDELQERRKADSAEPAGYHVIKECGKVGCSVTTLEEAEKTRDFWNKRWTIRPYFYTQPALVATGATNSPVIPDGYALVPVEPTDEMIAAAMNCEDVLFNSDESFCVQFGNIYEAMLLAAPQQGTTNF
ncbi:hypothetical protein FOM45_23080 [Salmonella enterica]|nr:hypothetical protein [Salmonella enterica]